MYASRKGLPGHLAFLALCYTLPMTTGDILNIVLAVVLLGVGTGIVWLLYYLVQIVKDIHTAIAEFRQMIQGVHQRLTHFGEMLDAIQSKVSSSASAVSSVVRAITEIVSFAREKKAKRAAKRSVEETEDF